MSPEEQAALDALADVLAFYKARVVIPPATNYKRQNITRSSKRGKQ